MSLVYHVVKRPDKSTGAGPDDKLYYGQVRMRQTIDFDTLCTMIADRSTASKGDVLLVIDGLLHVMTKYLTEGNSVQVGDFGNFRMSVGSTGTALQEDFNPSLFKKGRIVFTPGARLKQILAKPKFEKLDVVTEVCDKPHVE